jgi:GntR family transcriptional repressor for pyruvate dehydrogenase complex
LASAIVTDPLFKTETLADHVHRQLLSAIRIGEYAGQARLPSETEMAARFKVSRPVLRQALERLRTSGVITSKRGSGNFVVERNEAALVFNRLSNIPDVQNCLEFRCAVEGQAAATAARKRSAQQLEDIERAMVEFQTLISSHQPAVEADFAFHMAIARATNNPYFTQTMKALRAHITFGINLIQTLSTHPSAARLAGVFDEHRRILEAIRDADPNAAQRRMTDHLQAGINRLFPNPKVDKSVNDV